MKIGIIILARTDFGRWPDKILFQLRGRPIFEWVIIKAKLLGIPVIVSTTENIEDQIIVDTAERLGVIISYGNPDDRNERFAQAIIENKLEYFLSISPACPFFDVEYTGKVINAIKENPGYNYYNIGRDTSAVPHAFKTQPIIDNLDNKDRDQEIIINPKALKTAGYHLYEWWDGELKNRYLFDYNIAFKIQAETHKAICDYLGRFPLDYEDLRTALLEMDYSFTRGKK